MKPSLLEIQSSFINGVTNKNPHCAENYITSTPNGASAKTRFSIYQNAYWARISQSIQQDFPKITVIFKDQMRQIIESYLNMYPSKYENLSEVSKSFPEFIENKYPEHSELARIEFATLLAKNSAWPHELDDIQNNILTPKDLAREHENLDEIETFLIWNTSIQFLPTKNNHEKSKIIFLKNGEIETLDISQAEHQILLRKNRLNSLSKLLIALEASAASPDEVQLLFTKWTENEILFFLKNEPGFSLAP